MRPQTKTFAAAPELRVYQHPIHGGVKLRVSTKKMQRYNPEVGVELPLSHHGSLNFDWSEVGLRALDCDVDKQTLLALMQMLDWFFKTEPWKEDGDGAR